MPRYKPRRHPSWQKTLTPFLLFVLLLIIHIFHATKIAHNAIKTNHKIDLLSLLSSQEKVLLNFTTVDSPIGKNWATDEGFGACLMFKDDNELLYEWVAYHYHSLPLRHLVIGVDVGNRQDPRVVLQRWKEAGITDLQYRVINASEFYPYPNPPTNKKEEDPASVAHHAFAHRQKGFLTKCAQLLKQPSLWNGAHIGWTVFIDSDEYVTWNTWDETEDKAAAPDAHFIETRKKLLSFATVPPLKAIPRSLTVLDFLRRHQDAWQNENRNLTACYTLPRLRFGALQNHTCSHFPANHPSRWPLRTLQFLQHARKGDFSRNKFGKVMINLSELDDELIVQQPRNIHRPWLHCGPAAKTLHTSLLRVNHYLGSWQHYSGRSEDDRRSFSYWDQMAHLQEGQACQDQTQHWLADFVQQVGSKRAKQLLNLA